MLVPEDGAGAYPPIAVLVPEDGAGAYPPVLPPPPLLPPLLYGVYPVDGVAPNGSWLGPKLEKIYEVADGNPGIIPLTLSTVIFGSLYVFTNNAGVEGSDCIN